MRLGIARNIPSRGKRFEFTYITSLRGPWERESVACRAFILRVFSEANGLFHVDKNNSYCTETFFNTHYISEHIGFTILINESKCNVICVQK